MENVISNSHVYLTQNCEKCLDVVTWNISVICALMWREYKCSTLAVLYSQYIYKNSMQQKVNYYVPVITA